MFTHARDSAETAFCHVIPTATLLLFLPMLSVTSAAAFLWSPTPLPTNVALMVKVTEHGCRPDASPKGFFGPPAAGASGLLSLARRC